MSPKSSSETLMSRNASERTVPSSMGTSYVLPVRLSVTVSVSWPCGPPFVDTPCWACASLLTPGSSLSKVCGESSHVATAGPRGPCHLSTRAASEPVDDAQHGVGTELGGVDRDPLVGGVDERVELESLRQPH